MEISKFTYPEKEKLKSRKLIKRVFEEGKTVKSYPVFIRYIPIENSTHNIGVSVSKKNFKKAVDRIRIKRQLREAYRLNKGELMDTEDKYAMMIIFIGRKEVSSEELQIKVKSLFKDLQ